MKSKRHKIKTHEEDGIRIREVRPDYYMVDTMRDGRRSRACFGSLDEARTHCRNIARKISHEGSSVLDLTQAQRIDATQALRLLGDAATLTATVKFWMRHNGVQGGVTVAEAGRRWLANLKAQGCRETTIAEREQKLNRLVADIGERTVASVTRDEVEAWLTGKGLSGATWDGYRRAYHALFQYAVKIRLLESNPVAGIDPMRMDERLPTPLSVASVAAIMRAAEQYAPVMVPTLAVGFFAGLRPGEAMGLDWSAIDFKQRIIRVMPETSKVRRSRIIETNQTLIDWLTPYRKASGPIGVETKSQFAFYMHRKPIGEKSGDNEEDARPWGLIAGAGIEWIQDGARKTFATMHFAQHGDAGKLAGILGHSGDSSILYKHYRGLATKADAKRYWKIRPASMAAQVARPNFKRAAG
jgi:integrase